MNGLPLQPPYPAGLEQRCSLGRFWARERKFWELGNGIYATAVAMPAGIRQTPAKRGLFRPHRSYRSGAGGVRSKQISYEQLLKVFWESHNLTQYASGQRRRHPVSFRSTRSATRAKPRRRRRRPIKGVGGKGLPAITTEIAPRANSISSRGPSPAISGRIVAGCVLAAPASCPIGGGAAPDRFAGPAKAFRASRAARKRFANHNRCKTVLPL